MEDEARDLGVHNLRKVRYNSPELDRLATTLKEESSEGATLVILAGASKGQKRIAAEAIAKDLQLNLYRVDLRAVISKYIGETEKNLNRVFADASRPGIVLFFDEADALFGKRTDVKSGNDRYTTAEINHLLRHIDAFSGIVLMTLDDPEPARAVAKGLCRARSVLVL